IDVALFARHLAHRTDTAEGLPLARDPRRLAADLKVLVAVGVRLHPDRGGLVLRLAILFPAVRGLQNMAVGVNRAWVFELVKVFLDTCHRVASIRIWIRNPACAPK